MSRRDEILKQAITELEKEIEQSASTTKRLEASEKTFQNQLDEVQAEIKRTQLDKKSLEKTIKDLQSDLGQRGAIIAGSDRTALKEEATEASVDK